MAEKRIYDDSSEENGNSILVKRPKTGVDADPPGTSLDYQHLSGDEDRPLDFGNYKDPLSDLTKDQRVVLYTLFMSCVNYGYIDMDDDVSMGDIDVMKTVKELVDRGMVRRFSNTVEIEYEKQDQIMRSYRKNCLLSDIDKDFYIQVASEKSLNVYARVYFRDCDNSKEAEDTGPITLMRLIVEGRAQELNYYDIRDKLPPCEKNDIEEFGMFVKDWCKVRDIDPMALSDGISDERTKNFYSAFTILSGLKDGLGVWHFPKRKWSILISILLSQNYSICVSELWEVRRREIQQTFSALHDSKGGSSEDVLIFLQELIDFDNLLTSDNENKTVHFVSEDVQHKMMGYFVLNCLETTTDYENYINLSSLNSLWDYVHPSLYKRKINERCLYLPKGMNESFFRKLGVDAIQHVMTAERWENFYYWRKIGQVVSEILKLPYDVFNEDPETVYKVYKFLKASINSTPCLQSALSLNRFVGSFFIGEKTFRVKGILGGSFTPKKWSILVSILLSENYTVCLNALWKEKYGKILNVFSAFNNIYDDKDDFYVEIAELINNEKFLKRCINDDVIEFVSEDIRHCVMSYFVQNCLETDEDCKNYIKLSSVDSLLEYVRTWWYRKDKEERCMYLPEGMEKVLVKRLGIDVLCHVMVEPKTDSDGGGRYQEIREAVLENWKLPPAVFNTSQETRRRFCNFVKGFVEVQQHHGLNLSSFLGSFLINLNASKEKDHLTLPLSSKKMSILCTVLVANGYKLCLKKQWKDDIKKTRQTFSGLESSDAVEDEILLKELVGNDKLLILDNEGSNVQFVSDDVRHKVMSYFVMNCLNTDEDYINYINLSSVDSLLEYLCAWNYRNIEEKRCINLPEKMEEIYIKKLGINILCCVNIDDLRISEELANKLNIPKEILSWGYDARCRYSACANKGTQTIHRARAMIVGCAGAGKTTLLRRLQQRSIEELRQIQSTVGLEVYENLFEINRDRKCLKGLPEGEDTENKCLLSVVDFAGQCAYYACHQVYLSRRAFYLLVLDLSKRFDEKVDQTLCEQEGTMFADWTFGQYVIFWLKSIHTYCEDDTPVVTVATHCDKLQNMVGNSVYDDLLELLKDESDLKKHLDRTRCFHIGFPTDDNEPLDKLTDVEECIISIASEDRWKYPIPKDWAYCEVVLRQNKQNGRKCLPLAEFRKQVTIKKIGKEKETFDVLQYYHDIGTILYFNEDHLKDSTITDVQWFVDCFKHIITDPKHARDLVENDRDWQHFFESGYLSKDLLKGIWRKTNMDARKCNLTLKYMQRLGLLAKGQKAHYVPCMNKLNFGKELKDQIFKLEQKTSVLVFNFRFLPHFFYFRLIVACIVGTKWTIIEDSGQKCLFKNIAWFLYEEHIIALAVTTSTIQVQIFKQGNGMLNAEITKNIKKSIEDVLGKLTKIFHKETLYKIGYQCSKQDVLEENALCFIAEKGLYGRGEFSCPNHGLMNHHVIKERDLLRFWKYGDCMGEYQIGGNTSMTQGEKNCRPEVEISEQHACTYLTTYNIHNVTARGGIVTIGNKGETSINQDNSASRKRDVN